MFKDSAQQTKDLLEEAMGLFGMIEEVSLKCKMLKVKTHQSCDDRGDCWETDYAPDNLTDEVFAKVSKMHDDLDRYSHRLHEISEELKEINGTICTMDGAEGKHFS